jgi:Domain of unknown function (DUF4055)
MSIITNDPTLASYHDPRYTDNQDYLRFIHDMYVGREAWLSPYGNLCSGLSHQYYLPQEPKEDDKVYLNRLRRSQFDRRFGNSIDAFAGLLSRFAITGDLPSKALGIIKMNCDRQGISIHRFLIDADRKALRDGICYVLVDYPYIDPARMETMSFAEEQDMGLRPFLTLYDRRQVVNLIRTDKTGSVEIFVVKVLYPGGGEIYRCLENDNGDHDLVKFTEWQTTSSTLPLVPYTISISGADSFCPRLPFLDLAMLNLKHYQIVSEKDEIRRKCNIPILNINRKEGLPTSVTTARKDPTTKQTIEPEITIGPNTILLNAEGRYIEPTGAALTVTQADITALEIAMSQKTLDFLTLGDVSRTATEVLHTAAPLSASLAGMIIAKESAVHKILEYWQSYIGGADYEADIQIDEGSIRSTINSANIDRLTAMRAAGDLSRETYLDLVKEARVLPPSFDIAQEIIRLNKEHAELKSVVNQK